MLFLKIGSHRPNFCEHAAHTPTLCTLFNSHIVANISGGWQCCWGVFRSGDAEAEHISGGAGDAAVFPGMAELPAEACRPGLH